MNQHDNAKKLESESEQKTLQIAGEFSENLSQNSNIILLKGLLGAGKTTFVKGFSIALGVNLNEIKSPTYTYMRTYQGLNKKIVHLDLYRMDNINVSFLEELQELIENEDNYILIEWPEKIEDYLPINCNEVNIEHGESTNNRILNIKYAN